MAERLTGRHMDIPAVWYEQPIYYKANRVSVVGLDADVRWPAYAELLDYELELACVIGRGGVDIPAEQAAAHVFGFTIFNDISARDARPPRWRASSVRPRARTSTPATSWGRGW
jgi:2-keto-4-pentenoate hydratase/2-oxohepta-3-ene-1,7-dioic acid hydratase in catechol pathway